MKKETKDLLINMVETWNKFNLRKSVEAHFDESEFCPKNWALDIAIEGVISSDFMMFIQPVLIVQDCQWFFSAYGSQVNFHIQ